MQTPIYDPAAVASFYHLHGAPTPGIACRGLACFANRAADPACWSRACSAEPEVYCLGFCHAAPAAMPLASTHAPQPAIRCAASKPVLLGNAIEGPVLDLADYRARGGGHALERAIAMSPAQLIDMVSRSGLRGRGGAAFPAGRKWAAVVATDRPPVLVVNADEGDPGAFGDRILLEHDPFRLIEGMAIAAHAIGATEAAIYLRCEYPDAARVLTAALAAAEAARWPGNLHIRLHTGQGSYVCGEETSLLNSLEGRRPFVRARPPYPFAQGLHGRPTLVHNVETLCAIPWIVMTGADAYRALAIAGGSADTNAPAAAGTKLLSLNSLFRNPGLVEVPFGIPLRTIVEELGGGLRRGRLKGVMIGGPLAGLLPPEALDTPLTYEALTAIGGSVGHGGVIAFADDTELAALVGEVFRFGARESCGLCVPCHLGTAELAAAFATLEQGRAAIGRDRWSALVNALEATSLCGHGAGLAAFARSLELHFADELAACLK